MIQFQENGRTEGRKDKRMDKTYFIEPQLCSRCHDLSMVVYDLSNFMTLNIKSIDYRCYVFNTSRSDAIKLLNNSVLDNKGVL